MPSIIKSTQNNNLSTYNSPTGQQKESNAYKGEKITTWNDYPELRELNLETHNSKESVLPSITIKKEGMYFQKRKAWLATLNSVTIATILRPLQPIGSGNKMKPTGKWFVSENKQHAPETAPKIRTGTIKNTYATNTSDSNPEQKNITNPHDQLTIRAISLLPNELQAFIHQQQQKDPQHITIGNSFGVTSGTLVKAEEVKILVLANQQAIVIHAERSHFPMPHMSAEESRKKLSNTEWNVTQITYSLQKNKQLKNKQTRGLNT